MNNVDTIKIINSIMKKTFTFKVTQVDILEDDGEKKKLGVSNCEYEKTSRKKFIKDLVDTSTDIPVEICYGEPARYQMGHIYLRRDGKFAYMLAPRIDTVD
jgi:ribosomal protein L23